MTATLDRNAIMSRLTELFQEVFDDDELEISESTSAREVEEWDSLTDRLRERGVDFLIEPRVRFRGEPGEQATFFVQDPAGNALEFKAFADPGQLFATD